MDNNNLPDFETLFGAIEFKEGDPARSVYSPAAYLTDLLQLMDDEFTSTDNFYERRADIKQILLDAENTNTIIPYLDIVNEVLENKVDAGKQALSAILAAGNDRIKEVFGQFITDTVTVSRIHTLLVEMVANSNSLRELKAMTDSQLEAALPDSASLGGERTRKLLIEAISVAVYDELKEVNYPFSLPFNLQHERLNNHLNHLDLSPGKLNKLFAIEQDSLRIASEYLNLSPDELAIITDDDRTNTETKELYGFSGTNAAFLSEMSNVARFMEVTGLTAAQTRELLFQNVYVDINQTESGQQLFFINSDISSGDEYAKFDATEKNIVWVGGSIEIPIEWFDNVIRFIRLSKKMDISFIDLGIILQNRSSGEMSPDDIEGIAVAKFLKEKFDIEYDEVAALTFNYIVARGFGNDELPQDLFDRVFNNKCVTVDGKYLRERSGTAIAPQFEKDEFREIVYYDDLFAESNYEFRKRIEFALGFSDEDLRGITNRLESKKFSSSLWMLAAYKGNLFSFLHRLKLLIDLLDTSYSDLFIVFDIIDRDPSIARFNQHNTFINFVPDQKNCYEIFMFSSTKDRMWQVQTLCAIYEWMNESGFEPALLWNIATGIVEDEDQAKAIEKQKIELLNNMYQAFKPVELSAASFEIGPFDRRNADIIYRKYQGHCGESHEAEDQRLVSYSEEKALKLANSALRDFDKITAFDFEHLNIEEQLATKLFDNLVYRGYINTSGKIIGEGLPKTAADFKLESDFGEYLGDLFTLIHQLYLAEAEQEIEEIEVSVFMSDLEDLGLSHANTKEIYDNLIFNNYISEEGDVQFVAFFSDKKNVEDFDINTHLSENSAEVFAQLMAQLEDLKASKLHLSATVFGELGLEEAAIEALLENLKFNDYIDDDMALIDLARIDKESGDSMNLAMQFYPKRKVIYAALKTFVDTFRISVLRVDKSKLAEIADGIVSRWAFEDLQDEFLDGTYLEDEDREFFLDVSNKSKLVLSYYFDGANGEAVFNRIAEIIKASDNYRFTTKPLEDAKFDEGEADELVDSLIEIGALDEDQKIPEEEIDYFLNVDNALTFNIESFEDFAKDVFFMLNTIANAVKEARAAVDEALKFAAQDQEQLVLSQVQAMLGVEAGAVRSMSNAIFERDDRLTASWMLPLFAAVNTLDEIVALPPDTSFNVAFQRLIQFSLLTKKLQLTSREVDIAFNDQDLVMKFPEGLTLPDGVDRIDAILEDGPYVYLFVGSTYWIYRAEDNMLIYQTTLPFTKEQIELYKEDEALRKKLEENPIKALFEKEALDHVDAAFIDSEGNRYIVSGGHHYLQLKNTDTWDKRKNNFGQTNNHFENLQEIDAAYKDSASRLFLFSKGQYVRYTGAYDYIDEGYPKTLAENWADENLDIELPANFMHNIDASFEGTDDNAYFFKGSEYFSSYDMENPQPINGKWGHAKYNFKELNHFDAAYDDNGEYFLFSGDSVLKYVDDIENEGLQVAPGFPAKIMDSFSDFPDEFIGGIDAAFKGLDGKKYFFKDDKTLRIDGQQSATLLDTNEVWGKVKNNLAYHMKVSAALVGLDGKTYIFSGDQYYRYSGSDYREADSGYPASIAEDWKGLMTIDAAFVLDGKTYLFGLTATEEPGYIRYSTNDYEIPDEIDEEQLKAIVKENQADFLDLKVLPGKPDDKWWSLPESLAKDGFTVDAVLNGPDGKTYLFSGFRVVEYGQDSRWWSEPEKLQDKWGQIPAEFLGVDAAFTGKDGKIYLFYGNQYLRFSDAEFCKIDNGYPRTMNGYWGKIKNNIASTCNIDAAVVVESREKEFNKTTGVEEEKVNQHTYLFSGDQFFRYVGNDYTWVEPGYPKQIVPSLKKEPRFKHLDYDFEKGIDAAFADHRNVFLFSGEQCYAVSDENYHHYTSANDGYTNISAAFMYDGGVTAIDNGNWVHLGPLEDVPAQSTASVPRFLNGVSAPFASNLDTVLNGTDGNTYLFKNSAYYNLLLKRQFNISEEWGKVRNNIYANQTIDAGFAGRDGKTYVFSGDQYFTYPSADYIGHTTQDPPQPMGQKWGGLNSVALAYVMDGDTFLFEHPDAEGYLRYVKYSGDDYYKPDAGYPQTTDVSFWQMPQSHVREGFDSIDTIFVDGDNMIFISDQQFVQYNTKAENWSYPRELEMLYDGIPFNKTTFRDIKTGFVGADGKVYFFNEECYTQYNPASSGAAGFTAVKSIRDDWGLVENKFSNKVDASFVDRAGRTFLFSGSQYIRYSSSDYRYADSGYPKPIADCLRKEEAFKHTTKEFQNELDKLEANNEAIFIEGVVENIRNLYVFFKGSMFAAGRTNYQAHLIGDLGYVKNNFIEDSAVDASFVDFQGRTYLFSGDQYIRYSGTKYEHVDEGYPKRIADDFAQEFMHSGLPSDFDCAIDAAVSGVGGEVYLFKDEHFVILHVFAESIRPTPATQWIHEHWGKLKNVFMGAPIPMVEPPSGNSMFELEDNSSSVAAGPGDAPESEDMTGVQTIDGAYIDEAGRLYVYKGDQYVRYSNPQDLFDLCEGCNYQEDVPKYVDANYPMDLEKHCPTIPIQLYEGDHLDGAFRFQGKTYFARENRFVGFTDDTEGCQSGAKPRDFKSRWGKWSDYLLSDICLLSRFKSLEQTWSSDDHTLTDFMHEGSADIEEPYMVLANIFNFDKEDVRWLKRRNAFLSPVNQFEEEFGLEIVLRIYDILSETNRINVNVAKLYNDVWVPLYASTPNLERAANGALSLLGTVDCNDNYATLFEQIHSELNVLKRDALVPYVIHEDDTIDDARDLFKQLLIDIEMESCADTSRIVEATAAVQLYMYRYFVNLEAVDLKGKNDEEVRAVLKEQWKWMRNYRVWEANRKVFLYPENYIRPELRDTKTPSFEALQEGLMQGEITDDAVQRVYKKYLDEYTEVSELKIAGGYVFDDSGSLGADKRLVLFGRTKVAPLRYHYRFGTFVGGNSSSAIWEPWLQVNISIESERVYPVAAFGRVFVFWSTLESYIDDPSNSSVTVGGIGSGTNTATSASNLAYRIKVYYSFYNLNKEWVQPQLLKTEFEGQADLKLDSKPTDIKLFVEESNKLDSGDLHDNIVINVQFKTATGGSQLKGFSLTPELYSIPMGNSQISASQGQQMFEVLFDEGSIEEENVVTLNSVENSLDGPWFTYDHKGGGFMCKPSIATLKTDAYPQQLVENNLGLPTAAISAAVHVKNTSYFFAGGNYSYGNASAAINSRWGLRQNNIRETGHVDAAFTNGSKTYLFSGDQYYEYSGNGYTAPNEGWPKKLSGNTLGIQWDSVDAAFRGSNTKIVVFNNAEGKAHQLGSNPVQTNSRWGKVNPSLNGRITNINAGLIFNGALFILDDDQLLKYTDDTMTTMAPGFPVVASLETLLVALDPTFNPNTFNWEIHDLEAMYSYGNNEVAMRIKVAGGTDDDYVFSNGAITSPPNSFIDDSNSKWTAGIAFEKDIFIDDMGFIHNIKIGFYRGGGGNQYRARAYDGEELKSISKMTGGGSTTTPKIGRQIDAAFPGFGSDTNLYFVSGTDYISIPRTIDLNVIINAIRAWSNPKNVADKFNWEVTNNIVDNNHVDAALVRGNRLFLTSGDQYVRYTTSGTSNYGPYVDAGYPKALSTNTESLPTLAKFDAAFIAGDSKEYFFRNHTSKYSVGATGNKLNINAKWGKAASGSKIADDNRVDAAFVKDNKLFLIRKEQFVRYTLVLGEAGPYIDENYPKDLAGGLENIDAAFTLDTVTEPVDYLIAGSYFYKLTGNEPDSLSGKQLIKGNWGNVPSGLRTGMDAALNVGNELFFFKGGQYIGYVTDDSKLPRPYEIDTAPYEIIRLTSSTAEQLNQLLFAGGVDKLLQLKTQEIDEVPSFSVEESTPTNIKVSTTRIPTPPINSHIDFASANGIYYWEVFFHAPFLIAQSLNTDQKFEEAKQWYEYIYDPTEVTDYWKFLPFLAVDPEAMLRNAAENLKVYSTLNPGSRANTATATYTVLAGILDHFDAVFSGQESLVAAEARALTDIGSARKLINIATWDEYEAYALAIKNLPTTRPNPKDNPALVSLKSELQEVVYIIAKLHYRYDLMNNKDAQIQVYLDDPFDPHAIASLRRIAYRKTIVMSYIDNLLDWGDMLFRQYTRESITEARMFYLLAYDLLGQKPSNLGRRILSEPRSYDELFHYEGNLEPNYEFLFDLENSADLAHPEEGLTFAGTVHDSIASPYFFLAENDLFIDYWNRVEDRLFKIRHCQNILGIEVPLALFQPPIDPAALVGAVAGGGGLGAALAGLSTAIPHYRFTYMLNKARELTSKLNQFGGDLLGAIEKKDAEALSILQNSQEGIVLGLTTQIKEKQITDADFNIQMLQESKSGAENQKAHYERLLKKGLISEEEVQIKLMIAAASIYGIVVLSKIVSGLAFIGPQYTAGAFSWGVTFGGKNIGDMLSKFGEASDSVAEGLSMAGEAAGIFAQHKRSVEDWELQKAMATTEIAQLEFQIESAKLQKAINQRELQVHAAEIENNKSIATFMKNKFSNEQLYNWMTGKLSGIFFETYKLAHDLSKQAEKAFQFETGTKIAEVNFIGGTYWDSQRKGLLSGESLGLDLDKMEKAYIEQDVRGFEITKSVSLLELDPLAFLQLKTKGVCEFRFTEALFDYDFPGHYNRQIKSLAIAFDVGEGQLVNATLTQINHKLVMDPDIKAVKYLLNPSGDMPLGIRADWKVNQQIALSHVDEFTENSGLFELRFDSERYLPFEGTGAVSMWGLELNGKKGAYNPNDLLDATIKLRYTADQGGTGFANAVKGSLKPYTETAFFDLAYSFAEEWNAFQQGEEDDFELPFTRSMFPNMSSSKIQSIMVRYDFAEGKSASLVLNDDITLANNKLIGVSNISISKDGSAFTFTAKGDKTAMQNVEMVMLYKATV
jgi:hypothetical protein